MLRKKYSIFVELQINLIIFSFLLLLQILSSMCKLIMILNQSFDKMSKILSIFFGFNYFIGKEKKKEKLLSIKN